MLQEPYTLKFRTPLCILTTAALLSRLVFDIRSLTAFSQVWGLIQPLLATEATRYQGILTIISYFVGPLFTLVPRFLFLLYFFHGFPKHWGRKLLVSAYGVMAVGSLVSILQQLPVKPSDIAYLLVYCLPVLAFGWAAISIRQGTNSRLSLAAAPAITIMYGLYSLFFLSIPQIPQMLEAGMSYPELILDYTHTLCSFCGYAALLLFGLTHTLPAPITKEA